MPALTILVLHSLGDPGASPLFLQNHVHALRTYAPQHAYTYHDTTRDAPAALFGQRFDAVVLDVTFLCARWSGEENYAALRRDYAFIGEMDAVKLAFPQDEYDCNELLDDWLCDWGVDVVFSVLDCPHDVLYPRYARRGTIRLAYTGYIDESMLSLRPSPWRARPIDIGYRSKQLPPYFGRIGEAKWRIGERVNRLCRATELVTDILVGDAAALNGPAWLRFIDSCRFTLGANSGSSLLDPRGDIQRAVRAHLATYPDATFEDVERLFFPGQDGRHQFTAISPRVLEAAVLGSCQILVEGEYSGLIRPWEHYIPIRADAADFERVHAAMRDHDACLRMARDCRDVLLSNPALRYRTQARETLRTIDALLQARHPGHVPLVTPAPVDAAAPAMPEAGIDAGPEDARAGSRSVLLLSTAGVAEHARLTALAGRAPPNLALRCVDALTPGGGDAAFDAVNGELGRDLRLLQALARRSDAAFFLALGGGDYARVPAWRRELERLLRDAACLVQRARGHGGVTALVATDRAALLAGAVLRQAWRVPLMYDAGGEFAPVVGGIPDPVETRFWALLERRLMARVDYAQTVSLPQASRLTRETGTHFTAVPGAVPRDHADAGPAHGVTGTGGCRFGIDTHTAAPDDITLLLRAWARADSRALLEIRVQGAAEAEQLLRQVRESGLHDPRVCVRVQEPDADPRDDVTLLGARDAGVDADAMRLHLLSRAFARGVPVIAARHPALTSQLREYAAGVLVDMRDTASLVAAVDAWTHDAALRAEYAFAARACFAEAFHWEIVARLGYARLRGLADNGLAVALEPEAAPAAWPVVDVPLARLWRFRARRALLACARAVWHCLPWGVRQALIPAVRRSGVSG